MSYRKDDLVGIRKARFASFVLLLVCFAGLLVLLVLSLVGLWAYLASFVIFAVLVVFWWFYYRNILFSEAEFFKALATEMRAANRRLRILESVVRQVGDGVVVVSGDGGLVLINEAAKSLLAVLDDDLEGNRYDEHAADFNPKLERKAILEGAYENKTPEIISADGQFYKISYIPLVAEKGLKSGAIVVISDVTENTKAEKMQIEFVANVSHELKTPLSSVRLYAETLISGAVDNEEMRREFLEMIVSEADRMDGLIKDLLYLARVEHTGSYTEMEKDDLSLLVRQAIKKLGMTAGNKSLSVNQMFANDLCVNVEMDRGHIEQVLFNILGNAIKYTEEKGRIDIDIISGQNCVQIVISDNGVGISEEDLSRVFERFWRGDKARTGKTGGTGLGLAISKQIVDAHGGNIGIESKLGRGTTVTINLPTARSRGIPGIL